MLSTSYQNINKSLCYSPVLLALIFGAVSCHKCDHWVIGGTESGDTDEEPEHYWLHCLGEDLPAVCVPDPGSSYCVAGYTKEELCGHHYYGDQTLSPPEGWHAWGGVYCDYPNVPEEYQVITPCGSNPNPPPLPGGTPPCTWDDTDKEWECATDPTTGGDPTTGDPTTGSPEETEMWYCKWDPEKSVLEQDEMKKMCFFFMDTEDLDDEALRAAALNDPVFHSKCWQMGAQLPCAVGAKEDAVDTCSMDCVNQRQAAIDGLPGKSVIPEKPGETHDTWDCVPKEIFEDTVYPAPQGKNFCAFVAPVWDGSSTPKTFLATVSFTGSDGGSSSQTHVPGYVAMRTENCDNVKCDLVITAIEGSQRNYAGTYTIPGAGQMMYELEGVEFQLAEDLHGTWHFGRGSVTFANDDAMIRIWADGLKVNGIPVPTTDLTSLITIEQLSGTYRNGALSLTLAYPSEGSLLLISLLSP